jgi:hypothetical protein
MNELIELNPQELFLQNTGLTMTLKQIADQYGKENSNLMRDFHKMLSVLNEEEIATLNYEHCKYKGANNKTLPTICMDYHTMSTFIQSKRLRWKKNTPSDILYVISDGEYNKIGITTSSIKKRLKVLQTANARKLTCIFMKEIQLARDLELALHQHFADKRLYGEWFDVSLREIKKEIKRLTHV